MLRKHCQKKILTIPRIFFGLFGNWLRGIRTEGWYFLNDQDIKKLKNPDGHMYQPKTYSILKSIFKNIKIGDDDVFFDLGCS